MSDESDSQHQEEEEEEVQDVGLVKESQDNEYYSFLNVPRDASDQQINVAYKKLSRFSMSWSWSRTNVLSLEVNFQTVSSG